MRIIYQNSYEKSHADVFEARIAEINFGGYDAADFDEWTSTVLKMFKPRSRTAKQIAVEMGDLCIKESPTHPAPPSRIFRVRNPAGLFWYVDIIPVTKQFLFILDKEHTEAISPDEGIARLIHKQTGHKTRSVVSDDLSTVTVETGHGTFTTVDTRTQEDRKKEGNETLKRWTNDTK